MKVLREKILYSVLEYKTGDYFAQLARQLGATGATFYLAKGTVNNKILKALGLGTNKKDVVIINTSDELAQLIIQKAQADYTIKGVSAIIGGDNMDTRYDLITIIVNTGYSDDIMHAVRKVGAIGGTVADARGTALPSDMNSFLGITIVPEKEMIYMICEKEKTNDITRVIENLECLQKKGIGVMYVQPVEKFVQLG